MAIQSEGTRTLPPSHLIMAIRDCLDGHAHGRPYARPSYSDGQLSAVQGRLWREDPKIVEAAYGKLAGMYHGGPSAPDDCLAGSRGDGVHGRLAERMAELMRPLPYRDRMGLTVAEIAKDAEIPDGTLRALMEHHGYLETVPYGRNQNRTLVSDMAFNAEYGHNVDATSWHTANLKDRRKWVVFPVFYPEVVSAILWTLDYEGIRDKSASITNKRKRLLWLLGNHGYLPNAEVANLTGYSVRGVEKARQRRGVGDDGCLGVSALPLAA